MKTVPPSHFPKSNVTTTNSVGGDENAQGGGSKGDGDEAELVSAAKQFQLAMEHVHQVSNMLERNTNDSPINNNGQRSNSQSSFSSADRDSFIIKGGCPFRAFHQEHSTSMHGSASGSSQRQHHGGGSESNNNSSKKLARAMEDFSLAAIMGRMASESFDDGEENEEEENVALEGGKQGVQDVNDEQGTETNEQSSSVPLSDTQEQEKTSTSSLTTSTQSTTPTKQQPRRPSGSLLSQALKTGTAESHTAAENVHFVNNFIQGIIDRQLYMELITGLYHTYVTLESLLEQYAPTYFPTLHFPKELSRTQALKEDMEYWHGLNWETQLDCTKPSLAVQDYMDRMEEVGRIDPLLLLSHAYTRYLGDLSGGKVLSRIARRALNLSGYDGLQFYQFDHISSAKLFKDKYRQALDELILTPSEIGKLVAEANVAFALNMRVFEELDVLGGVEGARVRNVREALVYYDREMEEQQRYSDGDREVLGKEGLEEEAKCPFGFKGGPNPHGPSSSTSSKKNEVAQSSSPAPPLSPSLGDVQVQKKENDSGEGGGGRCPWPFVFFHDPAMGMKDWQTWFVIGILLCWCWSSVSNTVQ